MNDELESYENSEEVIIELLPNNVDFDNGYLVEIEEPSVLKEISNIMPNILAGCEIGKDILLKKEVVYKAIFPAGKKLVNSKTLDGAVRGFYRGKKGIEGHANLVKMNRVETTNIYLMVTMMIIKTALKDLSKQLSALDKGINKIIAFQKAEYCGKVEMLLTQINQMLSYQEDIVSNDELRQRELIKLDEIEREAIALLNQANKMINGLTSMNRIRYKEYMKSTQDNLTWTEYQFILLQTLFKVAEIKFLFNLGNVSRKYCFDSFYVCLENSDKVNKQLEEWSNKHIEEFGVELNEKRRKRDGAVGMAASLIQKKIKFNVEYVPVSDDELLVINKVIDNTKRTMSIDTKGELGDCVEVVVANGKLYYNIHKIEEIQ